MTDIILLVTAIVCISLSVYMLVLQKHYLDKIKAEAEQQHNTPPTEKTQQKKTKKPSTKREPPKRLHVNTTSRYLDVVTFCEFLVKENSPLITTIRPFTGRPNMGHIYRKFLKKFPKLSYQAFHKHYVVWEKSRQETQKGV